MNKSDIVSRAAAQSSLSRAAAESVVNAVFAAIGDGLAQDETVAIAGFGTFSIKKRPARAGRNPRTGERITIAASVVPAFKASKALRDTVTGSTKPSMAAPATRERVAAPACRCRGSIDDPAYPPPVAPAPESGALRKKQKIQAGMAAIKTIR